jgi:hypothetical protein
MARDDADLYRALLMSLADAGEHAGSLLKQSAAASERWERLLAAELQDPVAASFGDRTVPARLSSPDNRDVALSCGPRVPARPEALAGRLRPLQH